ncbi:MAG TPA: redoxin domain-containing protein [Terriglobales bacterium]|nr:redoxin domain-containing protein [Terriglobales bacterium]
MSDADSNAKKAISTARDAQERVGARLRAGIVLMAFSGDYPKRLPAAEAEFRQALAEAPDDVQARYQLGIVLLRQKKDEEGLKHLAVVAAAPAGDLSTNARLLIANPRRAREWFAPQFEATTLQGETVSLAALAGKVVVLDFWATWCPPCRASVPELKGLLKKYSREKLVLISISADKDEDTCRKFVAEKNMDWPQIFDADHVLIDRFNVNAFPTYLVVDGEGVVKKKIAGMDPQQSVAARIKDTLQGMKELN